MSSTAAAQITGHALVLDVAQSRLAKRLQAVAVFGARDLDAELGLAGDLGPAGAVERLADRRGGDAGRGPAARGRQAAAATSNAPVASSAAS